MSDELVEPRDIIRATYEALLAALLSDGDEKQHWVEQALWESSGRDDNAVRGLHRALEWQRGRDPKAGTRFADHDPLAEQEAA